MSVSNIEYHQLQFRFCATGPATADGSLVISRPVDCNQSTVDYLMSLPKYENNWFEVRGGVFGPDWIKTTDIYLAKGDRHYTK